LAIFLFFSEYFTFESLHFGYFLHFSLKLPFYCISRLIHKVGTGIALLPPKTTIAMLTIENKSIEVAPQAEASAEISGLDLYFASGLLGFELNKDFELIPDSELAPYQMLRGKDADQSFLVIPPGYVVEHYSIELADEDVALIGLENSEDAVVLNIATYHPDDTVTVNLKGPIVYNKSTQKARQVVPRNAAELSLAHPMGN